MKRLDYYWYKQNPVAWFLWPLSILFCVIVYIRKLFYSLGILETSSISVPVIVIGNIAVGGTGKTPLLIELCRQLQSMGFKPGVISRGYGGQAESWPQSVTANSDALLIGDEPLMIASNTQCPVVVGPDRVSDIQRLLNENDCNIILSDDGLQHYRMPRDLEIVVIDGERLMGNGFCLPAGPLREPVSRLKTVDMVIYNGAPAEDHHFLLRHDQLVSLNGDGVSCGLETFKAKTVHAVAGIGNPERFFNLLEQQGINIIRHGFADHHIFRSEDLEFNDDLPVLMTEKDAVKCTDLKISNGWYLPVQAELSATALTQFRQLIEQVTHG